jgi:type 1 fimbriae regulatory protein FimB/type 1 fimbriae regulatory protein FimE
MSKIDSVNAKPKVSAQRKHLVPEEARRLIDAAGKRGRYPFRDKVLLRVTYRHGLRASEAVGMRWDDIDLANGTMFVRRAKNGKDNTHSLDKDELRDLRKLRKDVTGIYVFETERGGPLNVDTLAYICREAGEAAGLPVSVHPHTLRHSAGYCLINDGIDVRSVQEFLGHKSIQSTAIYTALSPKRLAGVRVR